MTLLPTLGAPLAFIASLYLRPQARTSEKLTGFTAVTALFFCLTVIQNIRPFDILPVAYALCAYLGWMAYKKWYSHLERPHTPELAVGKVLPEFVLETPRGQRLSSRVFMQQKAIWLFFRGNWCPLCMAQINEMAQLYRELSQKKVAIILVSGQSHKKTQALAKRFEVPFTFLIDKDFAASKQLGLYHPHGLPTGLQVLGFDSDTIYPTVLITDNSGVICFADQGDNYRVRPEPALFLQVIEEMEQKIV